MSTSDGASDRSSDDPVLSGALAEMTAEGNFNASQPLSDLGTGTNASQSAGDASAGTPAALSAPAGDDGSVQTGSPAAAAPTTLDPSAAPAAADPLAGTEPFTYPVNGERKTLQGVYRVPGEGLMVPEEHVASIEALAERADVLDRVSREVTAQNATYERYSSWQTTDAEGKPTTLTGPQGFEAQRVAFARMEAAVTFADTLLSDPAKILSLIGKDEQGKFVLDPEAIENFQVRVQLAANTAEAQARAQFAKLGTAGSPQQPGASPPASYAASAPKVIEQAAGQGYASLSTEDRALLTKQIDRYIRPVTEEDRRWNPALKLGAPIVDAEYSTLVQHMVTQRQATKQIAKTSEAAGKHNAGMDKGRQPVKQPAKPAVPPPPAPPNDRKKPDWDTPFAEAMSEMGIPMR